MRQYRHLVKNKGVCGGRVVIDGTRIEPSHIVGYGTPKEIEEDFKITQEQISECYHYMIVKKSTKDDWVNMRKDWEEVGNTLRSVLGLKVK